MVGTTFRDWCCYFQYKESTTEEDKNKADARNALLVVATLIAAVTFQAGVNPPGGVWQESKRNKHGSLLRKAGTAVCASESSAYYVFLTFNTLAFCAASLVIMSLTHKFPFQFETRVAAISMIVTYISAIFAVTPEDPDKEYTQTTKFRIVLVVAVAPLLMRCLIQLFVKLINMKPEPPRLIQACFEPRNKTTELHEQT